MSDHEPPWDGGPSHGHRGRGHGGGRAETGRHGGGRGAWGGGPWGGARRMRRGDIRVFLLAALLDGPAHGYELMSRLETRSNGLWRPSPGSVYPTLQLLEEQGMIQGREDNGKRVFELTDAGRLDAAAGRTQQPFAGPAEAEDGPSLRAAVEQLSLAAKQVSVVGDPDQVEAAATIVTEARQRLYRLLAGDYRRRDVRARGRPGAEAQRRRVRRVPITLPYGSWRSPLTSDLLVEAVVGLSDVEVAGDELWWNESRPDEAGRHVLVASTAGGPPTDRIPTGFSARTAVHEYGGRSYAVRPGAGGSGGTVIFANWADQRLWSAAPGAAPTPLTPEPAVARGDRYADLSVVAGGRWLLAVRERHSPDSAGGAGVDNDLVAVALGGSDGADPVINVLVAGHDFFGSPRPSPDGTRVAWVSWDHPSMPWDSTELWVADLRDGAIAGVARKVAGGPGESVTQPRWSPAGQLHYVSDRTGWWNLYDEAGTPLAPLEAEFAEPDWVLGLSTYTFLDDGRLVATWSAPGGGRLGLVADGGLRPIEVPYTAFEGLRASGDGVVAVAGSPVAEPAVVRIGVDDGTVEVLRQSRATTVDASWLSVPEAIEFPTEGDQLAHALWYPPTNPDTVGPADELPPLVVISHGGPTSAATPVLDYGTQYWTSRGFGVVDVDYGGSSGYGRAYRQRLQGLWGVVDIDDCVAAAGWLAAQGRVDGERMVIRGGSAGGFTTLGALTFRDVFAAGASHYGVADLGLLARDTHKFESRYMDGLIGPYPEATAVYQERSPLHHVERLDRPLILFQGLEDAVVPPAQADLIASALAARGVPVAHLAFPGEQHGFRQAATIRRVIDTELNFYGRVLGFAPHDPCEPFAIVNEEALPGPLSAGSDAV